MFNTVKKIIKYPRLTQDYPNKSGNAWFLGQTGIERSKCNFCGECALRCPSEAIVLDQAAGHIGINYDRCIFCVLCEEVCPTGAVTTTNKFELAQKDKALLRNESFNGDRAINPTLTIIDKKLPDMSCEEMSKELEAKIKKSFGRSLKIREVDSGSCNGCDYEVNALNNPINDIERLGISFVASPRHADMLLVTGTGARNMQLALHKTYEATPDPKLVVAVGACACSGGIFRESYATNNGIDSIVPVDVYIPGCPPRPQAIIYGILKALDRVK